jgi:hypothetical protein
VIYTHVNHRALAGRLAGCGQLLVARTVVRSGSLSGYSSCACRSALLSCAEANACRTCSGQGRCRQPIPISPLVSAAASGQAVVPCSRPFDVCACEPFLRKGITMRLTALPTRSCRRRRVALVAAREGRCREPPGRLTVPSRCSAREPISGWVNSCRARLRHANRMRWCSRPKLRPCNRPSAQRQGRRPTRSCGVAARTPRKQQGPGGKRRPTGSS